MQKPTPTSKSDCDKKINAQMNEERSSGTNNTTDPDATNRRPKRESAPQSVAPPSGMPMDRGTPPNSSIPMDRGTTPGRGTPMNRGVLPRSDMPINGATPPARMPMNGLAPPARMPMNGLAPPARMPMNGLAPPARMPMNGSSPPARMPMNGSSPPARMPMDGSSPPARMPMNGSSPPARMPMDGSSPPARMPMNGLAPRAILPSMPNNYPMGVPLYPLYGYDNCEDLDRDINYFKQLYPNIAKRIQGEIDNECDKLEYDGSVMFDEYPDRVTLDRITDRIYEKIKDIDEESMVEIKGIYSTPRRRQNLVRDIVSIILLNEILNRRRRYRSRKRWF